MRKNLRPEKPGNQTVTEGGRCAEIPTLGAHLAKGTSPLPPPSYPHTSATRSDSYTANASSSACGGWMQKNSAPLAAPRGTRRAVPYGAAGRLVGKDIVTGFPFTA